MLYWTAHGIKAVRGPLVSASDSCSCASEDGSQETAHIQGKVFSVSLYSDLSVCCAVISMSTFLFQPRDRAPYHSFFLIVTYHAIGGMHHHLNTSPPDYQYQAVLSNASSKTFALIP